MMAGRSYSNSRYGYGFNGKEKDDEPKGPGAQYDYGFRIYDTRLGKFLSIDPLFKSYPYYTSYQFAANMPIAASDLDGLEAKFEIIDINFKEQNGKMIQSSMVSKEYMRHNSRAFVFGLLGEGEYQKVNYNYFSDGGMGVIQINTISFSKYIDEQGNVIYSDKPSYSTKFILPKDMSETDYKNWYEGKVKEGSVPGGVSFQQQDEGSESRYNKRGNGTDGGDITIKTGGGNKFELQQDWPSNDQIAKESSLLDRAQDDTLILDRYEGIQKDSRGGYHGYKAGKDTFILKVDKTYKKLSK